MNLPTPHPPPASALGTAGLDAARLRALRATVLPRPAGGSVLGHRAFMRAWAARRAGRSLGVDALGGAFVAVPPSRPCLP